MCLPDGHIPPRWRGEGVGINFFIKFFKSQYALTSVLNKISKTVIGVTVKNYTEVYIFKINSTDA